ncbi:MAG: heavy-metal-associated domain-containing protein [Candidatus Rokubacteria bacterium]|nr:heavy-metal-associated domain-containing protein [Candidatus Rokubacteria bacterium]
MGNWQHFLVGVTVLFAAATAAAADVTELTLKAEGMTPTGCSGPPAVQMTVQGFPGVHRADASLERGEVTIVYEADQLDLEKLIDTVERMCLVTLTRPRAR